MDSPSHKKGLKQAQLCFKTTNTKELKIPVVRKRKSGDLALDCNEAKALKTSAAFDAAKCFQNDIKKVIDLSNTEIIIKTSNICSDVHENGIAGDNVSVVVESKETNQCTNNRSVNSSTSTDFCIVKEENCDISVVNNANESDSSVITLSSSDESLQSKGFSAFSSSSINMLSSANIVNCAVGEECVDGSEKVDILCEKKDSNDSKSLSQQVEAPANLKPPRKRKKMSSVEAQQKSQQREKKIKEKEIQRMQKKRELQAKMEKKQLLKELKQKHQEKLKQEKLRKKKLEENERKERERLKQERKEQEEKERQQKLLMKEEKNRLKQQLLEAKMEEKKKKEEQKLKILEEKKKAEIEEEKKIQKSKAAFADYFLKSKSVNSPQLPCNETIEQGVFRPFQVKENMQLAPIIPQAARERFNKINLEHSLKDKQENALLYLDALKLGEHIAFKHKKTKCKKLDSSNEDMLECKEEGVIILDIKEEEDKQIIDQNLKAKLLQFSENVRPPYWGTWRKKSKKIGPRTPFARDDVFDYDVDSDEEWDEGGPGESLSGTEDEESEDDYEVDNEFFVPHGYLSADEENDDLVTNNPELHRERLKMKEQEFESERSRKTTVLRPILIGCFWQADNMIEASCLPKPLNLYYASVLVEQPIATNHSFSQISDGPHSQLGLDRTSPENESTPSKPPSYLSAKRPVPEEGVPYLIRLLHANTHSRQTVIKEFQEFWSSVCSKKKSDSCVNNSTDLPITIALSPAANEKLASGKDEALVGKPQSEKISKRQLELTIQRLCEWRRCPDASMNKFCWWVHEELREKYGLNDLPIPNNWDYVSKKDAENTKPVSLPATPSIKPFLHP